MYRRIELITPSLIKPNLEWKFGLMGLGREEVADAWIYDLRGPDRSIPSNTKFFFTEKGWNKVGRKVIKACRTSGQKYRIIAIKETDAQVAWKDKHTGYEVAIQPKRKGR